MSEKRRCGCEAAPRYEVQRFGPFAIAERYRCAECGNQFDVATTMGRALLIA